MHGHVESHHGRLRHQRLALALRRVPGVHMAHFVAEQGGQFGFVVELGQDAARHAHGSAGEGVRVDVVGIEHAVRVRHVGPVGHAVHALAQAAHVLVDRCVLNGAEVLRKLVRRHLGVHLALLCLAHAHHNGFPCDGGLCAALQADQRRAHRTGSEEPHGLAAGDPVVAEGGGQLLRDTGVCGHDQTFSSLRL